MITKQSQGPPSKVFAHCSIMPNRFLKNKKLKPKSPHFTIRSKRHCASFLRAAATDYQKPGGLKLEKCILSKFWRLEVRNQSVSRATPPPKATVSSRFCWLLAISLFVAWLRSLLLHYMVFFSLCISVTSFSVSNKDIVNGFRADPKPRMISKKNP